MAKTESLSGTHGRRSAALRWTGTELGLVGVTLDATFEAWNFSSELKLPVWLSTRA